jgi:hypothetical protein
MMQARLTITLVVTLLLAGIAGAAPGRGGLSLTLSYAKSEHSRDANTTSYSCSLAGGVLTCKQAYSHRHGKATSRRRKLTPKQLARVEEAIVNGGLLTAQPVSEAGARTPGTDVSISLTVRLKDKTNQLTVSGALWDLKNEDPPLKTNPTYQAVESLLSLLQDLAGV